MTISRVKPGNWSGAEELTKAQIDAVDDNFTYGLDTRVGQTDEIESTVAWTNGGLSVVNLSVNTTATVSASNGEINLYGTGSVGGARFPSIQGSTVELVHFLSACEARPTSGSTIGSEQLWLLSSPGTEAPYFYNVTSSPYETALVWRIPKIHGATIASAKVYLQGNDSAAVFTDSTVFPSLELLRVTRSSGATASLKSGTSQSFDTNSTLQQYLLRHTIILTADQNNTLSLANGDDFVAKFLAPDPSEANAVKVFGLSITYQVTTFAPAL